MRLLSAGERASRKRLLAAIGVACVLAAVAVVSVGSSLYDVVAKGRDLLPYESGFVYKIELLDSVTLYATEESRPDADKLSAFGLVAAATMAFMAFLLLRAVHGNPRVRRFYGFVAGGVAFLAADELLGIHETIGHNLRFLADLPGVDRPDDVVFAAYAIPLAVLAWSFRDVVLAHRRAVRVFAVGVVFFGIAVLADVAGSGVDEAAEALSAVCLLAGLVMMTATVLREELDLDGLVAARRARPAVPESGAAASAPAPVERARPTAPIA